MGWGDDVARPGQVAFILGMKLLSVAVANETKTGHIAVSGMGGES